MLNKTIKMRLAPGLSLLAGFFLISEKVFADEAHPTFAKPAGQIRTLDSIKSWRDFSPTATKGLSSLSFELTNSAQAAGTRVSVLVVPAGVSVGARLSPDGGKSLTASTSSIARGYKARAAVNGGYFNLSNGQSTSYVTVGGKVVADPTVNKALIENPKLKPFLPQIFNRSEIRFLRKHNEVIVQIARHNEAVPKGFVIDSALQGGPRLLPKLNAEEEAFVRVQENGEKVDSIGVNRTAARTAVAITADGILLIVCVAGRGQDEFSSGLTLRELATLLKNLGAVSALNLDGGTSSTMVVKDASENYVMMIGRKPETLVRSALLVDF